MKLLVAALFLTLFSTHARAEGYLQSEDTLIDSRITIDPKKNMTGKFGVFNIPFHLIGQSEADIEAGYSPADFFQLESRVGIQKIEKDGDEDTKEGRAFFILPLVGHLKLRPGSNNLDLDVQKNLSGEISYGGMGIEVAKDLGDFGKVVVRGGARHVRIKEVLAPGEISLEGKDEVSASGMGGFLQLQADILNHILLGASLEGSLTFANKAQVTYSDGSGRIYAKVRFYKKGRYRLSLYGDWYVRLTNFSEGGGAKQFQLITGGLSISR